MLFRLISLLLAGGGMYLFVEDSPVAGLVLMVGGAMLFLISLTSVTGPGSGSGAGSVYINDSPGGISSDSYSGHSGGSFDSGGSCDSGGGGGGCD
ncbi:hypothetical protein ACKC9G_13265 [Pokkaliibacter sp. CJK22405]|uniref:hypothetical protein n=1 Tax=Pokkaliibacter sp. CJK22405 TaxID=3384615 RepID=UPI00398468FA